VKLPRPRFTLREILVATVAVAIAALVLVLYSAGVLDTLERQTIDERFSVRGPQSPDNQIVIVAIDQKTLQTLGREPPLPRADYAQVLDYVHGASPRTIAIDTQFIGRSNPSDDAALLSAVARDGPVLLATHEGPQGPITVPADVPMAPGAMLGSAAIDKDPDGVLRRMLYAPVDLQTLAVRAAKLFRNQPVSQADFPDNHAWIDFRGAPGTFPRYSFSDVMVGRMPADAFTGKAVLIGVTDPVDNMFTTSVSPVPMPGVEVQANALWTVLAGLPLKSAGTLAGVGLILALIAIPAAITVRKSGLFTLAGSVAALVAFLGGAQLAFDAGWIALVTFPRARAGPGYGGHDRRGRLHGATAAGGTRTSPWRPAAPTGASGFLHQLPAQSEPLAGPRHPARARAPLRRRQRVHGHLVDRIRRVLSRPDCRRNQRVQPDARVDRTALARTGGASPSNRRPTRLGASRDRSRPATSRGRRHPSARRRCARPGRERIARILKGIDQVTRGRDRWRRPRSRHRQPGSVDRTRPAKGRGIEAWHPYLRPASRLMLSRRRG